MTKLSNLDVVYFSRGGENEELRYSLRSVEKNFPHRLVWIYGNKPDDISPDRFVPCQQGNNKWDNVREMLFKVCQNPLITKEFVLFNDDFFVMREVDELPNWYRCSMYEHIIKIEMQYNDEPTRYTRQLRKTLALLEKNKMPVNSYELHLPMIFDKQKLLHLLRRTNGYHGMRTIYGNLYCLDAKPRDDVKIYDNKKAVDQTSTYLSTDDKSFANGLVGRFIRKSFPERSQFERGENGKN